MIGLFRDPALDAHLEQHGWVVTPFLDSDEVSVLLDAHAALAPPDEQGLIIDLVRTDRSMMREVAALTAPIWARHIDDVFVDRQVPTQTFIVKHPGDDSAMRLHEDPTFVDEDRARSFVLWIPLVDTGPHLDTGHIEIIPGSEHLPGGMVGFRTPPQFRAYEAELLPALVPLTVPAGHAAVFDTGILHASTPNLSSTPRPALGASVVPADEPLIHVVATGRRHRRVHRVDRDFFLDYHPADVARSFPDGYPVIREFDDDAVVGPEHIAALAGLDRLPTPVPPEPGDLPDLCEALRTTSLGDGAGGGRPPMETTVTRRATDQWTVSTDLPRRRAGWATATPGTVVVDPTSRGVEAGPIAPADEVAVLGRLGGLTTDVGDGPADLLVVDEYGRAVLTSASGHGVRLVVVECPVMQSGLRVGDNLVQLDVGTEITWDGGQVVLWNEGPGQLVAVLLPTAPSAHPPPPTAERTGRWTGLTRRTARALIRRPA